MQLNIHINFWVGFNNHQLCKIINSLKVGKKNYGDIIFLDNIFS